MWGPQSRYTLSRQECRTKFPQKERCRAIIALHPWKWRCRTFLWTPPSHFHSPSWLCAGDGLFSDRLSSQAWSPVTGHSQGRHKNRSFGSWSGETAFHFFHCSTCEHCVLHLHFLSVNYRDRPGWPGKVSFLFLVFGFWKPMPFSVGGFGCRHAISWKRILEITQIPTVMQRLDQGEVKRYTVATPVWIQFWNVIPNFRICESQMDPIPELNRYTVAIQCWNGSHRWNAGESNRYTVAVQFWNGIQKMNPGEFNRYTVAVQFWKGSRTWNPGEFNRYTVAVQFWNGSHTWNPGQSNRYTVAIRGWDVIPRIRLSCKDSTQEKWVMEPKRIESLHCSGSILEWASKNEPRRIQSLHSSGSILERESHMEPRRIQSLYCSGSILEWESHMEPRTIESLHCSDSRLGCDSQNPTVMQRLDPGEVSRYTVATPVSIQFLECHSKFQNMWVTDGTQENWIATL